MIDFFRVAKSCWLADLFSARQRPRNKWEKKEEIREEKERRGKMAKATWWEMDGRTDLQSYSLSHYRDWKYKDWCFLCCIMYSNFHFPTYRHLPFKQLQVSSYNWTLKSLSYHQPTYLHTTHKMVHNKMYSIILYCQFVIFLINQFHSQAC